LFPSSASADYPYGTGPLDPKEGQVVLREILVGDSRTALWVVLALVGCLLTLIVVGGLCSGLIAIREGRDFEITFSLRPPVIRWQVASHGDDASLMQDGRSSDEPTVVRDEDNGEFSVPIEEHSAVR
jgi:hypothetical protein